MAASAAILLPPATWVSAETEGTEPLEPAPTAQAQPNDEPDQLAAPTDQLVVWLDNSGDAGAALAPPLLPVTGGAEPAHAEPSDDAPDDATSADESTNDDTPEDDTPEDDTPEDDTPEDDTPGDDEPNDDTPEDDRPEDEATDAGAAAGPVTYAEPVRVRGDGSWVMRLPEVLEGGEVADLAAAWAGRADVASVVPDRRVEAQVTPNDPLYSDQWHLQPLGPDNYSANLPGAWDVTTGGPDPVVAVIDTGYLPHPDLVDHIMPGYDFIENDWGVASSRDGDGRDADASDPGDWTDDTSPCDPGSSSWHGTHVAGTIGARTNNHSGVAGVNWNASIQPVRVLGPCGGYESDVADAITWAAGGPVPGVPANPTPARILNLSLGGQWDGCDPVVGPAVDSARALGALVVAAAGNDDDDAGWGILASCDGVLTVANTAQDGSRNPSSNYGSVVELAAPGTDVTSTLNSGLTTPDSHSYASYSGTSMATPHVAGVASLLWSIRPSLTADQLTQVLQRTATPFPVGSTCEDICGSGILNAAAAVALLSPPPPAVEAPASPRGVTVVGSTSTSATIAWAAPDTGGLPTSYTIRATTRSGAVVSSPDIAYPATTGTIPNLIAGEVYWFTVVATNQTATSEPSLRSLPAIPPFRDVTSFVHRQFDDFIGERPDAEVSRWIATLAAGAASGSDLVNELAQAPEWGPYVDPTTRLYLAYFDRIPDTGGIRHWIQALRAGTSLQRVSEHFASSREFQTTYGSVNDREFATLVYRNVMGRSPDAAGLAHWVDKLAQGMTRPQVVTEFSESDEHRERKATVVRRVNISVAMLGRVPTAHEVATSERPMKGMTAQVLSSSSYNR